MVLMTMVARIADGLPLTASMQEDEQVLLPDYIQFVFLSSLDSESDCAAVQ